MEPQFSYLTPADFDWNANRYPSFEPSLTNLAYRQLLEYFKAGLASFPGFRPEEDEDSDACSWSDGFSESDEEDFSDNERNDEQNKPPRKKIKVDPKCEAENASKFIQNARSLLDAAPGHIGDTLRSKIFAELQNGFSYKKKAVEIKLSVLLSIFGHEDLTQLSIKVPKLDLLFPEHKVFDTMASTCANLKELSIDVQSVTRYGACDEAYYWKPLQKLTSLESLTIIGAKLPPDLNIGLELKTLNFLKIRGKPFSAYDLCTFLLRFEFKYVAEVLASWSSSSSRNGSQRPSSYMLEEFLKCASNEACLQPMCRSLTSLTVDSMVTNTFWHPISAAFLLLACPNLKDLRTSDTFPYYKALQIIQKRKEPSPKTLNLTQLYTMPEQKENLQVMIQATPHCQELIIQGPSDADWAKPDYNESENRQLLHRLMNAVGEKASAFSVVLRGLGNIEIDELPAFSLVSQLRIPDYSMMFVVDDKEEGSTHVEQEPALKHLRKLVLGGCWKDTGEAGLLVQCPNLEELYFQCIHFCSTGKELIDFASRHWRHLQVLYIKSMEHVQWASDDILAIFQVCPKLRTLVLPYSVLRSKQKEDFVKLHTFTEEKGAQVRYASPEKTTFFCGVNLKDKL